MKPGSWWAWKITICALGISALSLGGCGPSSAPPESMSEAPEPIDAPAPEAAPPKSMPEFEVAKDFPMREAGSAPPGSGDGGSGAGAGAGAEPKPDEGSREFSDVPVYFATDRNRTNSIEPDGRFGPERNSEGDHLSYGRAIVTIPKTHQTGRVERPAWWRFEFREDPAKHVTMLEPVLMNPERFYAEMRASTESAEQKELLMFVHGFNVRYADAMRRTGQIAYDLGFGGIAFCYSWPSQGDFAKYPVDKENSEWTTPHLAKVLVDLQKETKFEKVHIIAHSMGTRVLSYGLRSAQEAGFSLQLNNVILAAPDIDADIFREQILPKIKGSTQRLTMYASSGDQALNLSTKFNGSRRLGLSGDGLVVVPELMDTVDASGIDTSLIGHSYYGSQGPVVQDLFKLVIKGLQPPQRNLVPGSLGEWELPVVTPQ